jgi:hypothetical protein
MASTWTVGASKAVRDGRRLVDWLPDVVVELVRAFDVARTDPARFGDHSAHSRHGRTRGDARKTAPASPQVLNEGRTDSKTQTTQQYPNYCVFCV